MVLDGGADPAGETRSGLSPLHWATLYKVDPEIVKALLLHGADASAEDDEGMPVLMYGLSNGNSPEVIGWLLESGANPNIEHGSGLPLLHELVGLTAFASRSEYIGLLPGPVSELAANGIEIIELLLKHGADAGFRDDEVPSILFLYFATLVEAGSFDVDPYLVSMLLDHGASATIENDYDAYILEYAMQAGADAETVGLLMEYGANPRQITDNGETLLHAASRFGSEAGVFRLLLSGGAEVNAKDTIGATPLHHAAAHAGPEVVELLLEKGADIAALDNLGNTPLHSAMTIGLVVEMASGLIPTKHKANPEVVRLLLTSGADVGLKNEKGETPLILAAKHQIPGDFAFLNPRASDNPLPNDMEVTPAQSAAHADTTATISLLLEHGAKVNAEDQMKRTPLHWAAATFAASGSVDAVALLLDNGGDVNASDLAGDEPLHLVAKESGNWPQSPALEAIVRMLLAHGADLTAANGDGDTACDLARKANEDTSELFCH